jgi:isoleucyl-tRNA synthetase
LRKGGVIGKSLEAKLEINAAGRLYSTMKAVEPALKEIFNVSQVHISQTAEADRGVTFGVGTADGHKCDRCWNYYADDSPQHVRQFGSWPNVCGRCADALRQMGFSEDAS